MANIEKYIEKRVGPTLKKIEEEFGPSAATLARTLLLAFGENATSKKNSQEEDKILMQEDDQILIQIVQAALEKGAIFLDHSQPLPVFGYLDRDGNLQPLFREVPPDTSEKECILWFYEDDKAFTFEPDPLVDHIITMASDMHRYTGASEAPMFIASEDSESVYWARKDLMLHLIEASVNSSI